MARPNVITIIADDMGAWACGKAAQNQEIVTPNLDYLCEEGLYFSNFYCVSPVCSPARASIYSGSIPSYHGVFDWIASGSLDKEQLGEIKDAPEFAKEDKAIQYMQGVVTYTELMQDIGYHCSLSGKWHLGDSMTPQAGYQDWYTIGRGGCEYIHPDIIEDGQISFKDEYVTHLITDKALDYLDKFTDGQPHYLNVTYTAPHSPWEKEQHPAKYRDLYADCPFESTPDLPNHPWQVASCPVPSDEQKRREYLTGYYAAISAMDEGIGKIIAKLKQLGVYGDTLIIFTSDNGMSMGHHGIWGKGNGTFPLNMYDSAVKVPMIMSWPKMFAKGKVIENNRSHYDIFPTLVDYLQLPTTKLQDKDLPGKSLRPVIENDVVCDEPEDTIIFDEYGATRMIRNERFKLVKRFPYGPDEFYDLSSDPQEEVNLIDAKQYQAEIKTMYQKMIAWFNRYADPAIDGTREAVSGSGQLKLAGAKGDGQNVYRPIKQHMFD